MTTTQHYDPIFALERGGTVESVHYGSIAVVNAYGELLAWYGDPDTVTYLRSTAKPFQALPFLDKGGSTFFNLSSKEIAIMCASHSGTDTHVEVVKGFQNKTGVKESELLCGVHLPFDRETAERMRQRGEELTPNRHNCSGKHTGMLAFERLLKKLGEHINPSQPYVESDHPVQQYIVKAVAEICDLKMDEIRRGVDGCSAPNFALPLRNVALGFARLWSPEHIQPVTDERIASCKLITSAMVKHPDLVGGPGRLDTELMRLAEGKILSKAGAEAFQGIAIQPGVFSPDAPAIGIALKISDGDARRKVRAAVVLEVLHQMGTLTTEQLTALSAYGPCFPVYNWRKLEVGKAYPTFELQWAVRK